jgi:adenylate kinase
MAHERPTDVALYLRRELEKLPPLPVVTRVIITGPPAGGKGTQCESIREVLGVVHLSTGDMLRDHAKRGTELGQQALTFMNAGELVPDEVMVAMVLDRLQQEDCRTNGSLLDGFPRTPEQARALSAAGFEPTHVIALAVSDENLIQRVAGRRLDPVTGDIYHMQFKPPPNDPAVQGRLVQRGDDTEEKCRVRIATYKQHYAAIAGQYGDAVTVVDGNRAPKAVNVDVLAIFAQPEAVYEPMRSTSLALCAEPEARPSVDDTQHKPDALAAFIRGA